MKSLVPIVLGRLLVFVISVLGIKLVSHLVPPAVYGPYALFLTLTQLGLLLTHSGLVNHVSRYWQRETPRAGSYVRFVWHKNWQLAFYLAPILLVVTGALAVEEGRTTWLLMLPLLLIGNAATALGNAALNALNAAERYWLIFLMSLIGGLRSLVPVLVVYLAGATALALSVGFSLYSLGVIAFIMMLFGWAARTPEADSETVGKWAEELRTYGRPFVLIGIGGWLLLSADRWVVAMVFGSEQAGLFALATAAAAFVPNLVAGTLMQWVFPKVFRSADFARTGSDWQKLTRQCDKVTAVFLGFTLVGLFALALVGPYLLGWLIDERYAAAMPMLLAAGLAAAAVQVNQFYYLLLQGQHNSGAMVRIMLAVAGLKTAGSVIAAFVSWQAFLNWLTVSLFCCLLLGRYLTRIHTLRRFQHG